MKITEFNIIGKNVNISIDGEFWAEIPYIVAFDYRLQKGKDVDDSLLLSVEEKLQENKAFDYCIWYLSKYSTTTKKMRSKLYEKGHTKSVIDKVINKLTELKYLDDYIFAENLVAKKSAKLGKNRLKSELLSKGVALDIIEEVIGELQENDVFDSALNVAKKWYRSHELESHEDYQKFLRFMAYRGFDYDTINRCKGVLKFGENE